jgi:sugar phosphate isomerase/epimerase
MDTFTEQILAEPGYHVCMSSREPLSRRSVLALAASAPLTARAAKKSRIPVGLELYSVREELKQDLMGTVRGVAKMGYEVVEFYAPYFEWKTEYAKEVRKLMDDLGIRCLSTHNSDRTFTDENLPHAIELNQIIGSKTVVMASAGRVQGLDGWKKVAETLSRAADKLQPLGMRAGYHNHKTEFVPIEGKRPMETLAANTGKDVTLQLDVGTCVEAGSDPVAWVVENPGRIRSMHCKEWSPQSGVGFKALFGEGAAPWKKLFQAAEKSGGVECYLIEQEGSRFPPMETAERCLTAFRKLHS